MPAPWSSLTATICPSFTRRASSLPSRSRSRSSSGCRGRSRPTDGQVLGGDEAVERGHSEVGKVDPPEQSVPVGIVRLAGIQEVARGVAAAAARHLLDEVTCPQHLLVEVVDLAVLDLEIAPDCPAQPARFGPSCGLGLLDGAGEIKGLVGRKGPFAHLGVRARRQIDTSDRPVPVEPGGWRDSRSASLDLPPGP